MDHATARALGQAWRSALPWTTLTRLCEIEERLGGHPGERRAADVVADAFEQAGARAIEVDTFEMHRWSREHTRFAVRVPDERGGEPRDRSFEAIALPYAPAADVRGDLVDVGYGTPREIDEADVAGNVVVASTETPPDFGRPYHRMEKLGHATAAGASGFVFANHIPGQLPPTGSLRSNAEAAIPGVGVSMETGEWLTEYAARDATATVQVDATTETGQSQNVQATLGPDTDDEVLVLAHYDAHDVAEGALDNGCGVAVVVGAVELLARIDLEKRVRVVGVGSEEIGLVGSEVLADRLALDRVAAVVNVDGAGRFRDLRALTHASEQLEPVVETVADESGHPIEIEPRPHPHSDHWPFVRGGVPAVQLHSQRPGDDGHWERGWTHTRADTRDKVDKRNLREHAVLTALLVARLTQTDFDRLPTERLKSRLQETGYEQGMRAANVWPEHW